MIRHPQQSLGTNKKLPCKCSFLTPQSKNQATNQPKKQTNRPMRAKERGEK